MKLNILGRHSLKARVTVLTLVIFLLGVWVLTFFATRMLREDMERQLGDQLFSTVSLVGSQINGELAGRLKALEMTAGQVNPAAVGDTATAQALLERSVVLQDHFNGGIVMLRADGTTIADFPLSSGRSGVNCIDRANIAAALKDGKSSIGQPVTGRKSHAPVFTMAAPIRDAQDRVIGALVGVTDLSKPNFLDRITESRYGRTGGYVLTDADPQSGMTVTATDKSLIMRPNPAPGVNPLFDRYVQGFEGYGSTVDSRGFKMFSSAKRIPAAGWLLVGRVPEEDAFAPIRAVQQRMLLAALILTLVAGGLTGWITLRMLNRQLAPMLAATSKLDSLSSTDQIPEPLPITSEDEIGGLIGGFNRLLQTLARREKALKESESRFRQMFENNASILLLIEPDSGAIVDANAAAASFYGYSIERLRTMNMDQINVVAPAEIAVERHRAADAKRDFLTFPQRLACGEIRTAEVRSTPISVGGNTLLFSIISDISERAHLELEREQYFKFFQLSTDPMCIADPFGCFKQVNPAFARVTGYSDSELVSKPFLDFVLPEDRQRTAEEMKLQVERRSSLNFENRYVCKDGRVIVLSWTAYFDKSDGVTYATARDITELRRAENDLERFFALVPDLMCIASTGGYFLKVNSAWQTMLGYTEKELFSVPFIEFVHPDDREQTTAASVRQVTGEEILNFVNRYRCKDGSYRWLEWRTTAAISGVLIFATARDITDRKQAQDAMRAFAATLEVRVSERTAELQRTYDELESFSYTVSHDLRAPLRAINGYATLIETGEQALSSDSRALLDRIKVGAVRMGALIDDTIAFQRLGRAELLTREVMMTPLVQEVVADLTVQYPRTELAVGELGQASCDPATLKQVLTNLIANALKFSGTQAQPRVEIGCRDENGQRIYFVKDNGVGFDMAHMGKLFGVFERLHRAEDFPGTGIGLAIVKRVIERHGGRVWAEGAVGKGATFYFTLAA